MRTSSCIGVAIGTLNGVLVTSLGIPSFIVTLALFLTWTGVTLDAVQSQSQRKRRMIATSLDAIERDERFFVQRV